MTAGASRFRPVLRPPKPKDPSALEHRPLERRAAAAVWNWWAEARAVRDALPWREVRDPWLTLVAETMLAQTQASRVAERFPVMAARFPTPDALARVSAGEVVAIWVGLGYNRRAVALHSCAQLIVERHGGSVPRSLEALMALPGVGPYTARAVLSFAFGDPVGVVDTNVGRVLARAFAGRSLGASEAQALADRLVPTRRARDWNLALMDLGHLLCRRRGPLCQSCSIASSCRWRVGMNDGTSVDDPAEGSAGVSGRQARFEGSNRQGRGRLVAAAAMGPIPRAQLAQTAGWPDHPDRAAAVADALVREGLLVLGADGSYRLTQVG